MSTTTLEAGAQRGPFPRSEVDRSPARHGLLRPLIGVFRNLRFRSKALIIAAAFLVPTAFLGWHYVDGKNASLRDTAAERAGVTFSRQLLPAVKHARQLRRFALSEAVSGTASARLGEVRTLLDADLVAIKAIDARLGDALGTRDAVAAVAAALQGVEAPSAGVYRVFSSHDKLATALSNALDKVADGSGLMLDPDLDSYYLMHAALVATPRLLEQTARTRVLAVAMTAGGEVGAFAPAELSRNLGLAGYLAAQLGNDIRKVAAVRPERKAALDTGDSVRQVDELLRLATSTGAASGAEHGKAVDKAGAAVVEKLETLQLRMLDALDELLAAREAGMQRQLGTALAVVTIFLGLAGLLFHVFIVAMNEGLGEVGRQLGRIAGGDLCEPPRVRGQDEAASLLRSLADMQASLHRIVRGVRAGSDDIAEASAQIAAGSQDLSARTEQTATIVEQSAASIEHISSTFRNTADHAQKATSLATSNATAASRGGDVIGQMVSMMNDIRNSSGKIEQIIGVIDGIAFQTNILALNAAVEAARAGESGRGFAVVATEVRALAQRSAGAAREIKSLISDSVEKVRAGTGIVEDAGHTMTEIVGSSREVELLLGQIAADAREQTLGVGRVGEGITRLDRSAQGNVALGEETAAAAASLRELAAALSGDVARFKLSPSAAD